MLSTTTSPAAAAERAAAEAQITRARYLSEAYLATAPGIQASPGHRHLLNEIIGYVVRQTIEDGAVLPAAVEGRPGRDVRVVAESNRYSQALVIARRFCEQGGAWAVVDVVYGCGCRS